jgi:S1-C subfamily serine protease
LGREAVPLIGKRLPTPTKWQVRTQRDRQVLEAGHQAALLSERSGTRAGKRFLLRDRECDADGTRVAAQGFGCSVIENITVDYKNKISERILQWATVAVVLLTAASIGYLPARKMSGALPSSSVAVAVRLPDFVPLAQRFAPSLVHISTGTPEPGAPEREILGSGIVVSAQGHIVTNHHLVERAAKISVKLADRRELDASVVARDAFSDIALLKVNVPSRLKPASFGDSSRLEPGQWVLAMGSPFGLDRTVTAGIVSAKARRIPGNIYHEYIQTDIAINPGNSGGPLLDLKGNVVGINTAMISHDGQNSGISFALPGNSVKALLDQTLATGTVSRGWLGVSSRLLHSGSVRSPRLLAVSGALIMRVEPHSPAERAGLRSGDLIVGYNGRSIPNVEDLPGLVAKTPPGRVIALDVSRGAVLYKARIAAGELGASGRVGDEQRSIRAASLRHTDHTEPQGIVAF